MRFRYLGAALGASLAWSTAAEACALLRLVEYTVTNGGYQIDVNGVYLDHGGGNNVFGGIPIRNWIVEGENIVSIRFDAEQGDFSIKEGCEDSFEKAITVDQASLNAPIIHELSFTEDDPVEAEYMKARIEGDAGLMGAVAEFERAMRERDFETVWTLHRPMRREYRKQGAPMKTLKRFIQEIVAKADPVFAIGLKARPVLGGRVYEVLNEDFEPPVTVETEYEGGQVRWTSGTFWGRFKGGWRIVER